MNSRMHPHSVTVFCTSLLLVGCQSVPSGVAPYLPSYTAPPLIFETQVLLPHGTTATGTYIDHPDVQRATHIVAEFLLARSFICLTNAQRVAIEASPYGHSLAIYEWRNGSKVWWAELGFRPDKFCVGFYLERGGMATSGNIRKLRAALALELEGAFGKPRIKLRGP